jgi:sugar/nucleoside kinase (ribokinase family)
MSSRVFVAGAVSWNHIVNLDALPAPVPHMEFVRSHHWTVGGTSAGKALNLRSLGVPVTLRTVVGADEVAGQVLSVLRDAGIELVVEVARAGRTEQHLNLMGPSGRRVSLYLESPLLADADVRFASATSEALRAADAVVIDLSEHSRPLLAQARSLGRAPWCDLHDYDGSSAWHQDFVDAAGHLFLNDDKIADPETFARDRIRAGAELVVVTRGAAGAFAMARDGIPRVVAAEPVDEVVDTNGAGDAFFAGYLAAQLEGRGVEGCLRAGAHQAARCIQTTELAPRQPPTPA